MTSRTLALATASTAAKEVSVVSLAGKALALLGMLTVLTGVLYPLTVTFIARGVFPAEANGGLLIRDGKVVGSRFIGQPFEHPKYFWGRLSATAPAPYNAGASTGSNLGPTNDALTRSAERRIAALRAADPDNTTPVPVDLVTASASGLDPHITPAAARYQAARVARARGWPLERVQKVVDERTEGRMLGILGEPRVNVLLLNLALDETK
jgi:K+-transporting ATPase ATPase C chain